MQDQSIPDSTPALQRILSSEALTRELRKPSISRFQTASALLDGIEVLLVECRPNRRFLRGLATAIRAGALLCSVLLSAGVL